MTRVAVVFHSGYGHTRKVAEAVQAGAASVAGVEAGLIDVTQVGDAHWAELERADAIVFGAPTYMGGPSGEFKKFADASSSKAWFAQAWKDKIAGGFTCSLNMSGDKFSTLMYFVTLSMQHGMVWVGLGQRPERVGDPSAQNRLGSYLGVMAQADNVPPDQSPPSGDLETGRSYGRRIAEFAKRMRRG